MPAQSPDGAHRARAVRAFTGSAQLVERDDEIALLRRKIRALQADRSGMVTVTGPRGSGRSALLKAAVVHARAVGLAAAFARCAATEADVHRGVISQLSAGLSGAGCRLPGWTRLPGRAATEPTIPTLCGDFVGVASQTPLLIAVDDVDWADPGSREWLLAMAHRLQQAPILFVRSTVRADARSIAVPAWPVAHDVISVLPLTEDGVRHVVTARFPGCRDNGFVEGLRAATGGSPALLHPVLDRLAAARLEPVGEQLPMVATYVADARDARLSASVASLPADALALFRAIAVCHGLLDFDLVASLAAPLTGSVNAALDVLTRLGLVDDGPEPRAADDVTANGALAGLTSDRRQELAARAVGLAYRAAVADERLAELLLHCRPIGTSWVVDVLRRAAAQRRAAGDHNGAKRLLVRALREPVSQTERRKLLLGLGMDEVVDQPESSDLRLQRVLIDAGPEVSGAVLLNAADLLYSHGDARSAHRVIAAACRRRSSFGADTRALEAIGWLAQSDCDAGPVLPVPAFPAPAGRSDDMVSAGAAAWQLALDGTQLERTREAARLALTPPAERQPFTPRIQACRALFCTDDLAEAVLGLTDVLEDASRGGARAAAANALVLRARCELRRGNYNQAETDLDSAAEYLPARSWHPRAVLHLHNVRAELCLARVLLDEAEKAVAADLPAGTEDSGASGQFLLQRGAVRLARGDYESALTDFRAAGRGAPTRRSGNVVDLPWRSFAAVALKRCGEDEAADAMARDAVARAEAWGAPSALGLTNHQMAQVFEHDEATSCLELAVDVLRESPLRIQYLTAVADLAAVRLNEGRTAAASALLDGASVAQPLLLPADLAKKIRELSARLPGAAGEAGLTDIDEGNATSSALTEQEERIAALAAVGRTNAEIARALGLSARAVEFRFTQIYRKLTVTGRGQLSAVRRTGPETS
jgi:DNA-binding NarL/FixJ family response regulator